MLRSNNIINHHTSNRQSSKTSEAELLLDCVLRLPMLSGDDYYSYTIYPNHTIFETQLDSSSKWIWTIPFNYGMNAKNVTVVGNYYSNNKDNITIAVEIVYDYNKVRTVNLTDLVNSDNSFQLVSNDTNYIHVKNRHLDYYYTKSGNMQVYNSRHELINKWNIAVPVIMCHVVNYLLSSYL